MADSGSKSSPPASIKRMARTPGKKHEEWYREERPRYESLARAMETLISGLLTLEQIEFLAVTSRAKTVASFTGKLKRKTYKDPARDVTDLCGVRVITYLEVDVARVSEVVEKYFDVDRPNSYDKSATLAVDKVGYRSVHFVCSLSPHRLELPEYQIYHGLKFEIQVRTALQHAWAQIEHDRNYKLSGSLPDHLQRRLYLAAGLLEIADREFDAIAKDVDAYSEFVASKTAAGELDVDLNSTSYLSYFVERFGDRYEVVQNPAPRDRLIGELRRFGVSTLQGLDSLLTPDYLDRYNSYRPHTTDVGIVRGAMMDDDLIRYFATAYQGEWTKIVPSFRKFLEEKHGLTLVERLLKQNAITFEEYSPAEQDAAEEEEEEEE